MSPSASPDERDPTAGYPSYGAQIKAPPKGQALHDLVETLLLGKPADTMGRMDLLPLLAGGLGPKAPSAGVLNEMSRIRGAMSPRMGGIAQSLRDILKQSPQLATEFGKHFMAPKTVAKEIPPLASKIAGQISKYAPGTLTKAPRIEQGDLEQIAMSQVLEKLQQGKAFTNNKLWPGIKKAMGEAVGSTNSPLTQPPRVLELRRAIENLAQHWGATHEGQRIPFQTLQDKLSNLRNFKGIRPSTIQKALSDPGVTRVGEEAAGSAIDRLAGTTPEGSKATEAIKDLMAKLPERTRKVVEMSVGSDKDPAKSVTAIAKELGVSHPAVSQMLSRAKTSLAKKWPQEVPLQTAEPASDVDRVVEYLKGRKAPRGGQE